MNILKEELLHSYNTRNKNPRVLFRLNSAIIFTTSKHPEESTHHTALQKKPNQTPTFQHSNIFVNNILGFSIIVVVFVVIILVVINIRLQQSYVFCLSIRLPTRTDFHILKPILNSTPIQKSTASHTR